MVFTVDEPYVSLVQELLELKNYDDIKSVIDIGMFHWKKIKEYYTYKQVSYPSLLEKETTYTTEYERERTIQEATIQSLQDEIHHYKKQMEQMRSEFYREKDTLYQEMEERNHKSIEWYKKNTTSVTLENETLKQRLEELQKRLYEEKETLRLEMYQQRDTMYRELEERNTTMIQEYKDTIDSITSENKELKQKLGDLKKDFYTEKDQVKEELETMYKREIQEYKNQLKQKDEQFHYLTTTFENMKREEIDRRTLDLKKERDTLKDEINYYKKLYVDKSKGSFYEKELLPLLNDYNNKRLNNKWRIIHVGSTCNEKCDFQFRNKDTGDIILIDTKNNDSHKPVPYKDVEKFIKDIEKEDNKAIGGILIANSYITNKKSFEMDTLNNKTYIYISNFSFNNVEFIFSMMDLICEQSKSLKNKFDEDSIRSHYIEQYKFLLDRIRVLNQERKKYEEEINRIKSKYHSLFNDDIDIKHKGLETKEVEKIVIKDIINFEELEKDCKIVGKRRTKYYLKYNDGKKDIVQYFANNYPKRERMNKLKQMKGVKIYEM